MRVRSNIELTGFDPPAIFPNQYYEFDCFYGPYLALIGEEDKIGISEGRFYIEGRFYTADIMLLKNYIYYCPRLN